MKKFVALLLALVMVLSLAACGSKTADTDQPTDDGDSAAAEFTTANKGVLTMATNATFPPYEYVEGNQVVGIDAEIAAAIADKLGLELQIEDMEFDSIIEAVKSGKADIGLAGMTVTPDRQEEVNFTETYATGVQVVIVTEDSPITSVDDLFAEGGEERLVRLGLEAILHEDQRRAVGNQLGRGAVGLGKDDGGGAHLLEDLAHTRLRHVVVNRDIAAAGVEHALHGRDALRGAADEHRDGAAQTGGRSGQVCAEALRAGE